MMATVFESSNTISKILCFNNGILKELYSGSGSTQIYRMSNEIYIDIDKVIHHFESGNLHIQENFKDIDFYGTIGGRNEKDIFGISKSGIVHYNGGDWELIYEINLRYSTSLIFDKDIFFIYKDVLSGLNIVLRGKLK
jgi:hypothetical protein